MVRPRGRTGLTKAQAIQKRLLDIVLSVIGLVCLSWLILLAFVAATIDTRANGFFRQERIGYRGRRFKVIKIRSMRDDPRHRTSVTTSGRPADHARLAASSAGPRSTSCRSCSTSFSAR